MIDSQILAFSGIAAILTITPGSDTILVMRSVLTRGRRAGLLTTFGICCGVFIHAVLSALGLSWILVRSSVAFEILKILGSCYLIFLGCQSLWQAFRDIHHEQTNQTGDAGPAQRPAARKAFIEGMLNNVLNPKVAVFYLAFLPQFISPGDPVLAKSVLLAGIHFTMGIIWLSLVTFLLGRMRVFLSRPRVKRGLEAATGFVLIGFGLSLAAEKR
jgi:RhtB (resistance to homoserine/threonine) family protein